MNASSLPSHVKVGPFLYEIINWESGEAEAANCLGRCDLRELRIRVRTDMPQPMQAEILVHEIMHAIWSHAYIDDVPKKEETIVSMLAMGFAQVLRDNPHVVKFIQYGTEEEFEIQKESRREQACEVLSIVSG